MQKLLLTFGIFSSAILMSCSQQQIVAGTQSSMPQNTSTANSIQNENDGSIEQVGHTQTKLIKTSDGKLQTETTNNVGSVIDFKE